jgi:pyrroline-5-carboxylate reductase
MEAKTVIGIIGFGNMGSAISRQLIAKYRVYVFDKDPKKTLSWPQDYRLQNLGEIVEASEVIILAVKPQDIEQLLLELKDYSLDKKIIISIAAGISINYLKSYLARTEIVRVMPNLPAMVARGVSVLVKAQNTSNYSLAKAEEIFAHLGVIVSLKQEELIDAITAISGSGPAYVCYFLVKDGADNYKSYLKNLFLPRFKNAAKKIIDDRDLCDLLTTATVEGTLAFLENQDISPEELQKRVTSKGGTTEAAINVLNDGGSLTQALQAAKKRASLLEKK